MGAVQALQMITERQSEGMRNGPILALHVLPFNSLFMSTEATTNHIDTIVAELGAKTGLSAEHARTALHVVLDQLKSHLPASVGGQLLPMLEGKSFDMTSAMGETLKGWTGAAGDKLEDLKDDAGDLLKKIF
jgi:hypothetical protein